MSQAPPTSDKPMFYFALFPFISQPVISPHLATRCAALCAEEQRGRVLCRAALDHSLLPAGFEEPVGAMLGDKSCPPRWLPSCPSSLHTRAAFPLISHSGGDGFSPCEPDVLHGA